MLPVRTLEFKPKGEMAMKTIPHQTVTNTLAERPTTISVEEIVSNDKPDTTFAPEGPAQRRQPCHVTYDRNLGEFVLTPDKK